MERNSNLLHDGDKLPLRRSGLNWSDLRFFLGFVRMGDFVADRLANALKESGLNLTQVMICAELAVWHEHNPTEDAGISLKELTTRTGAPRARSHAQLKKLMSMELVRSTEKTSSQRGRGPGYRLTRAGLIKCQKFAGDAKSAQEAVYEMLLFRQSETRLHAWGQMNALLTKYLRSNGSDD